MLTEKFIFMLFPRWCFNAGSDWDSC